MSDHVVESGQSAANARSARISLECRLYVWSILVDPLLFFVILDQASTGVNLTLARLLQLPFVLTIVARLLQDKIRLPNPTSRLFKNYSIYVCLLLASSVAGLLFYGTYHLENRYTLEQSSMFVEIVRGSYTRPFVEFVILLYYFGYYTVLPKYMIRTRAEFEYLFKWLVRIFYWMLIIGLLDVISNSIGGWYIPKHSSHADVGYVGVRFHALLGEPRDAFPYLLFGMAVLYLRRTLDPGFKVRRVLFPLVLAALVMTQSISGVIGLAISAIVLLIYFTMNSFKQLLWLIGLTAVAVPLLAYLLTFSSHVMEVVDAFSDTWYMLNNGREFPYLVQVEAPNILPLWQMWLNLKSLNILPVLFGSGLGTTSVVNNNLTVIYIKDTASDLLNSNTQITRIMYESGIVGFLVYLSVFISPMKVFMRKFRRDRVANFTWFVLLLGASLSHRGSTIFIYLGIVIALISNWRGQPDEDRALATAVPAVRPSLTPVAAHVPTPAPAH